jgi:hypothetical protein
VISSIPASPVEVGGDAEIYVDPDDGDRWRDAIIGLSANKNLREGMAAAGRKRARLFSWKGSEAGDEPWYFGTHTASHTSDRAQQQNT